MHLRQFLSAFRQGKAGPAYYLEGPDRLLHEECRTAVQEALPAEARPWCFAAIEFQPGSLERELENARQMPMLGGRNFLFFSDAEDFRGVREEDTEALERYLQNPAAFSTVIFAAVEPDRRRRFIQLLEKKAEKVELLPLSRPEATEWVREFCRARGVEMDSRAAGMMAEKFAITGPPGRAATSGAVNVLWMRTELEKLLTAKEGTKKIAIEDLKRVEGWREEHEIGKMLRALAERRCGETIETMRSLLASKVAETLVLWCIGDLFRQALQGAGGVAAGRSAWAVRSNPFSTWEIARVARRAYSQQELLRALRLARQADLGIKSSWKDSRLLMEMLIWEISSGKTGTGDGGFWESEASVAG
jgi:DNA polymerase III delta subunit